MKIQLTTLITLATGLLFKLFIHEGCSQTQNTVFDPVFEPSQSNIAVWLSGAAYCGMDSYKTMKLAGPAEGFELVDVLYDPTTDLQGFTGIMHSEKTIYVAFRGSSSLLNWIDDAEVVKVPYDTFPNCDCKVHTGFYKATNGLKSATITSVQHLMNKYGYMNVVTTGHSLGAAIGQMISMELRKLAIKSTIYNFGQPRIGDAKYAKYVNVIEQTLWRFTHNQDTVPHLPPEFMGYVHSCVEMFEDEYGAIHECSDQMCEDPKCADQYSFLRKNGTDHHTYLGHPMDCKLSTI